MRYVPRIRLVRTPPIYKVGLTPGKPTNPLLKGYAIGNANGLMLGIAALDPVMETQQQIWK